MSRWFTPKELEADVAALLDDGAITDVGTAVRYYEDFLVLTEAALRRSPAATIALLVGRPS